MGNLILSSLDVVILSNTINDNIFEMNNNCIHSLLKSESNFRINIILIESNRESVYKYDCDNLIIITPEESFGYNKFANIGLKYCKSDFIAVCNNDIIFHPGWLSEIYKVSIANPDILSFSPFDGNCKKMKKLALHYRDFYIGWDILKHVAGWCLVFTKELLDIIPTPFDERFTFYYSDNDYGFTLKNKGIKHALVTNAKVDHLGSVVTDSVLKNTDSEFFINVERFKSKNIPECLYKDCYKPLWTQERLIEDFLIFYEKWGEPIYLLKVSILIVITETTKYFIEDTVNSALLQSWGNKEIIVVDISEGDSVSNIIKKLTDKFDCLVYYKPGNIKSASEAGNYALKVSTGDIIQFLNSGNLLSKYKIEEQMIEYDKACDDYAIITSAYLTFKDSVDTSIGLQNSPPLMYNYIDSTWDAVLDYFNEKYSLCIECLLLSRDIVSKTGCLNEELHYNETEEFIVRLMLKANSIYFCNRGISYKKEIKDKKYTAGEIEAYFRSVDTVSDLVLSQKKNRYVIKSSANYLQKYNNIVRENKMVLDALINKLKILGAKMKPQPEYITYTFSERAYYKIKRTVYGYFKKYFR